MTIGDITKPRCIKASDKTFHKLKVISVITENSYDKVLNDLLSIEMNRLNIEIKTPNDNEFFGNTHATNTQKN